MAIQNQSTSIRSVSHFLCFTWFPTNSCSNYFSNSVGEWLHCETITDGQVTYKHKYIVKVVFLLDKAVLNGQDNDFSLTNKHFKCKVLINFYLLYNFLTIAFIMPVNGHRYPLNKFLCQLRYAPLSPLVRRTRSWHVFFQTSQLIKSEAQSETPQFL